MSKIFEEFEMSVEKVMHKDFIVLRKDQSISDAAELIRTRKETALPVVHNKIIIGILSERDCLRFLYDLEKYENPYSFVETYMSKEVVFIHKSATLEDLIALFSKTRFKVIPVVENGEIVGMVYRRDLLPYIEKIRAKLLNRR